MRVLLINPSLLQAEIGHYSKRLEKGRGVYPSLGLCYVASSLKKKGHQVSIVDWDTEPNPLETVREKIGGLNPQVVGFYTMTWTFRQVNEIVRRIREWKPDVKFVAGGPNVSSFPKHTLELGEFDYAVQGEGEETVTELMNHLEGGISCKDIKGLIWRDNGSIVQNAPRSLNNDLDGVAFPAWELLHPERYHDVFAQKSIFATLVGTRGCPWSCTFCDRKNRMGSLWRTRSPQNIAQEMKWLNLQSGVSEFMFFDDNFVIDKKWIREVCEEIKRNDLDILWECRARVDMVDKPVLQAMKEAGCYRIRYGMEAGDDNILRVLKKGITVEQIKECSRITKEVGIEIFAYFMMGSPYETPETLKKTLNLAMEIDADFTIFSKTILIVGSELFDWGVKEGYISKDYWVDYLQGKETNPAPALSTKELPEHFVDEYISYANKMFYLRPGYVLRRLANIKSFSQFYRQINMARAFFG